MKNPEARRAATRAKYDQLFQRYRGILESKGVEASAAADAAWALAYVPLSSRSLEQHGAIEEALSQVIGPLTAEGQADG